MWFLLPLLLLSACQTMDHKHFGLSQNEWQSMSEKNKESLVKKYWQVKKRHTLSLKHSYVTPYPRIHVKFMRGTALMWPQKKQIAFMPVDVVLRAGSCKQVELFGPGKLMTTHLEICYDGKNVSLDPSHWQLKFANGALVIARHHLWQQGMSYNKLNSNGYAALKGATIFIRTV